MSGGIERKWQAMSDQNDALKEEVRNLRKQLETINQSGGNLILNDEESEVMNKLIGIMDVIATKWKLRANHGELTIAIHSLQGFIIQHALGRTAPDQWGNWWEVEIEKTSEEKAEEARQRRVSEAMEKIAVYQRVKEKRALSTEEATDLQTALEMVSSTLLPGDDDGNDN